MGAIPKTFSTGLESPELRKRLHTLTKLSELLKYDGSQDGPEKPPYTVLWDSLFDRDTDNAVVDIFPVVFEKIVRVAILDDANSAREAARTLLKELSGDGEHRNQEHIRTPIHACLLQVASSTNLRLML
jgi:hypothetical protein